MEQPKEEPTKELVKCFLKDCIWSFSYPNYQYPSMVIICSVYEGMGVCINIAYHKETKKYFAFADGGSNDYERYGNRELYSATNFKPEQSIRSEWRGFMPSEPIIGDDLQYVLKNVANDMDIIKKHFEKLKQDN